MGQSAAPFHRVRGASCFRKWSEALVKKAGGSSLPLLYRYIKPRSAMLTVFVPPTTK